jgi:hypothetical protein
MPRKNTDQKITIYRNADKHLLLNQLYSITRKQVGGLHEKSEDGDELSDKDMKRLDLCYDGLKKLIGIEKELKSDAIGSMPDEELRALVRKTLKAAKGDG